MLKQFIRAALVAVIIPLLAAAPASSMDSKAKPKKVTSQASMAKARTHIKAKEWGPALKLLRDLEKNDPNADVYNLLGYSLRKQGNFDESYVNYQKALKLDPNHKSAHEYLGELYIQKGDIAKAKEQAAILAKLCPKGCEEREDLDESLTAALKKN